MNPQAPVTRFLALGAIAITSALTGCASGPSASHEPAAPSAELQARSAGEPLVARHATADAQLLLATYEQRGYVLVGSAGFNGDRQGTEANAIAQGRQIGAELVVLLTPRSAGAAARPAVLSTPASSRNGPATAFGSNAGGIALEVGPTRTRDALNGHSTPLAAHRTSQRADLAAVYFVKQRDAAPAL